LYFSLGTFLISLIIIIIIIIIIMTIFLAGFRLLLYLVCLMMTHLTSFVCLFVWLTHLFGILCDAFLPNNFNQQPASGARTSQNISRVKP